MLNLLETDYFFKFLAHSVFKMCFGDGFFQILAHPVFKMSVIQKPNKVAL